MTTTDDTPEVGPYGLVVHDRVYITPLNRWGRIVSFHGPQVRVLIDQPGAMAARYRIFDPTELVLASGQ